MAASMIRQSELAEVTGYTVASIRHMQAHDYTPWDDHEFASGKHRRYSGLHALALVCVDLLKHQGVPLQAACEVVNDQVGACARFLAAISAGDDALPLFIARVGYVEESDKLGLRPVSFAAIGTGTEEELLDAVATSLARIGSETREGWHNVRVVAGPYLNVVEVPEAYRLLERRARASGYSILGTAIQREPRA